MAIWVDKTLQQIQVFIGDGGNVHGSSGRALFGDCPACGPTIPVPAGDGWLTSLHTDDGFFVPCATCGGPAKRRGIALRKPRHGKRSPACGSACLSGKTSCDCQCRGRCHGAGVCHCGTGE